MVEGIDTTTVCIEVPLKVDREVREEGRRLLLVRVLYALGGVLVLALFLFVAYRVAYPY